MTGLDACSPEHSICAEPCWQQLIANTAFRAGYCNSAQGDGEAGTEARRVGIFPPDRLSVH